MIAALLLAAVAAPTAIDAERAFAADAQKVGQWTAFRKWAAPDALMFTPQPVKAHDFLKDRKDPPAAVFWWPGRSYVSCDGMYAVNTGPWIREWGKSVGYFTTVWKRQPDGGWKWIYDAGDALPLPRAEGGDVQPQRASCDKPPEVPVVSRLMTVGTKSDGGSSPDDTLTWFWAVAPNGRRSFQADLWNGKEYKRVIDDQVAAPPP